MAGQARTGFHWRQTEAVLAAAWRCTDLHAEDGGRAFVAADPPLRVVLPAVLPPAGGPLVGYLEQLPQQLGSVMVVLLQAGAAALGWWNGEELARHVALARYVVRGHGRAQPTHLARRGKSRYGSRLRLANAVRLLQEVNERQCDWLAAAGAPPALAFLGAPVRLAADLFASDPPPPLPRAAYRRVPHTVHRPRHAELLRVFAALCRGEVQGDPAQVAALVAPPQRG